MEYVELGNVATYINGYAFKPEQRGKIGLPIIRIQDLNDNSYDLGFFDGSYPEQIEINTGDILISWSGSLGVYKWSKGKALLNQHIFKVVFNKINIDKEFFCYAVKNSLSVMSQQTHGATMKHITKKDFDKVLIPYPSLNTQRKIAQKLNIVTELIVFYETELSLMEQLIKTRFVEMFGDPSMNSHGLELLPMARICEIIDGDRGKNYPNADDFTDDGFCLFLNAKNVTASGFDFSTCTFITKEKDSALRKGKLSRGDVVLTTRGTIGNLAFYTSEVPYDNIRINSGMVILRMKQNVMDELFFIEQFKMQLKGIKEKIASGSAQPQLPISVMNKIQILVPNIKRQKEFELFVKQVDKSREEVKKSLEKTQQLYDSLMQEYFG